MGEASVRRLQASTAPSPFMSCHTEEAMLRYALALRDRDVGAPAKGRYVPLYHVTTPKNVTPILRDGFKDSSARKGAIGITTWQFEPGVWLANVPPITVISVDQYMGHEDEAWIELLVDDAFYADHMRGHEWQDASWPTRQWLIQAADVNKLPRREIALVDVLRLRIADCTTEHNAQLTAVLIEETIRSEMGGETAERWLSALNEAVKVRAF